MGKFALLCSACRIPLPVPTRAGLLDSTGNPALLYPGDGMNDVIVTRISPYLPANVVACYSYCQAGLFRRGGNGRHSTRFATGQPGRTWTAGSNPAAGSTCHPATLPPPVPARWQGMLPSGSSAFSTSCALAALRCHSGVSACSHRPCRTRCPLRR